MKIIDIKNNSDIDLLYKLVDKKKLLAVDTEFIREKSIPNLILSGGPGVGKTTAAKAMLEKIKRALSWSPLNPLGGYLGGV